MRHIFLILLFFSFQFAFSVKAEIILSDSCEKVAGARAIETDASFHRYDLKQKKPNPIFKLFKRKQRKTKKVVAALLAFPFPFGIVGLHRIYLGTKPYVPVAYIASLGGIFGLLPLIDFCVLLFDKDYEHYEDNGKVFMWIR